MNYQIVFGVIAVVIGIASFIPYFINLYQGKTKPHAFSWFIWGVLATIVFFAQLQQQGGAGIWVTGVTAFLCFAVSCFALSNRSKYLRPIDWFCLFAAILGIILWKLTSNPLTAVIIVTIVDAIGFYPTYRKGYLKPYEETVMTYVLAAIKWIFGITALETVNLTNALYPLSAIVTNTTFAILLLIRRKR